MKNGLRITQSLANNGILMWKWNFLQRERLRFNNKGLITEDGTGVGGCASPSVLADFVVTHSSCKID